jgi:MFS family permease
MKINKKAKSVAIILAIALVVYNVILFVVAGFVDHTAVFWLSRIFVLLGFATMALVGAFLGKEGLHMRDWIFGFPMLRYTYIYLVGELIFSVVFMLCEHTVSWELAFVLQFLLVCIYLVFVVGCFFAKRTVCEVKTNVKDKTMFIRMLRIDAEMLVDKCSDPSLKEMCKKLAEDIRFSDPMSNEALFELEKEITLTVSSCNDAIAAGELEGAKEYCIKASVLLSERNKKCKVLK